MGTIVTTVNDTSVSYQRNFTYTMNISFSGIQGDINSAQVKVWVPSVMDYTLPGVQAPIQSVTATPGVGGTIIIIDFGAIINAGITVAVELLCQYNLMAVEGTSTVLEPEMWINGALHYTDVAPAVTLVLIPHFTITNYRILPAVDPVTGSTATYTIALRNLTGDKWGRVNNVAISLMLPEGLAFNTGFLVVGNDASAPPFVDPSADGLTGTIVGNTLTFNLPTYKGTDYRIMYQVDIVGGYNVGDEIPFQTNWTIEEVQQLPGSTVLTIGEVVYDGRVTKYGPDYTLPNQYINYEFYIGNYGNINLQNVAITDELPIQVNFYSFSTGTYYIEAINQMLGATYTINYETRSGGSGTLGTFNTDVNTEVLIASLGIPPGDELASLSINLAGMTVGLKQNIPAQLNGVVKADTVIGDVIINHMHMVWDVQGGQGEYFYNQNAVVDNLCVLRPSLVQLSPNTSVRPGQEIRYSLRVDCRSSRLFNPTIATLLPAQLEYVGDISVVYTDYFSSQPTPKPPAPPVPDTPTPLVYVQSNFAGTGKTLVRFNYLGAYAFEFRQRATIHIDFTAKVRVGALGVASANMLLDTPGTTGYIPSGINVYMDYNNISDTGEVPRSYAESNTVSNAIVLYVGAGTIKKVKGTFDSEYVQYPLLGTTYEGGIVDYRLEITNTGNINFETIEIVDILPHIGDTGVIETSVQRGSEFVVYNINQISATINPLIPGQVTPVIAIWYSKSYNPVRFGNAYQTIGEDNDWTTIIPAVITELRSFKVMTQNTKLYPGQTLTIQVQGVVSAGVSQGDVAYNSYAAKISYINSSNILQYLLPTEPEKIGLEVLNVPSDKVQIGGFAWDDVNDSGIYELGEEGLNDIVVVLYNDKGVPLKATVTAPNSEGIPGYYLFNNLEPGTYLVRFVINTMDDRFSPQVLNNPLGSKVDPATSLTPLMTLAIGTSNLYVNAGIITLSHHDRMERIITVNKSANHMMRSVIYNQMLLGMKLEEVTTLI